MATQAQIESALIIQGQYSLITGAASFTDITNYAGLGISSPDTVKTILWIIDPVGQTFYKNAGYDAADFSSPDLEPINGDATYLYPTLPTVTGGDYMQGQYTINMKVQVVEGSDTVIAFKALYQNVTATCNGIVTNVAPNVTYNTAVVSVTDNTSYKNFTALSVNLKLYPPPTSGQAMQEGTFTGAPATLFYEPDPGNYPYTGVWTWKLTSDVTYTDATTGAATTCRIIREGTFNVVQSQLCKVYCLIRKYRNEVLAMAANRQTYTEIAEKNLIKAEGEYILAYAATMCGKPQTEIDVYINNIYVLINKSPDCDCGCDDGTSQPLVPTSIINGTDGADGSQILYGNGAPSGGTGVVGDSYIDTATGNMYLKTGESTWAFKLNIKGATGADGTSGVVILSNQFPSISTLTTNFESLLNGRVPYTLPKTTLGTNLDEIQIFAQATCSAPDGTQKLKITFGATDLTGVFDYPTFYVSNVTLIKIFVRFTRITNTTAKYYSEVRYYNDLNAPSTTRSLVSEGEIDIASLGTLNFTTTDYDIDFQGKSATIGDITSTYFEVLYLHLGLTTNFANGIQYIVPFNTSTNVTIYPNVIGTGGKTMLRVYLDGVLLNSSDWSYNNTTDTLTFNISITGVSQVAADYQ